jgi:hypothetical protein
MNTAFVGALIPVRLTSPVLSMNELMLATSKLLVNQWSNT